MTAQTLEKPAWKSRKMAVALLFIFLTIFLTSPLISIIMIIIILLNERKEFYARDFKNTYNLIHESISKMSRQSNLQWKSRIRNHIYLIQREEGTIYISFCLRLLWYLNSTTF